MTAKLFAHLHQLLWNGGDAIHSQTFTTIKAANNADHIFLHIQDPQIQEIPQLKLPILIRDRYQSLLEDTEDFCEKKGDSGMAIIGNPGIGKSLWLYFVLVKRLLQGKTTLFQCDDRNTFYIFDQGGVFSYPAICTHGGPELCFPEGTWALVDSSGVPHCTLLKSLGRRLFIVQATSAPSCQSWKEWRKQRTGRSGVMITWELEEIYIAAVMRLHPKPSFDLLAEAYSKFGGIPQICFDIAVYPERIQVYEDKVQRAIQDLTHYDLISVTTCGFSSNASPIIIAQTSDQDHLWPSRAAFHTQYIAQLVWDWHILHDPVLLHQLFSYFYDKPKTRSCAGYLWEPMAYKALTQTPGASACCQPLGKSSSTTGLMIPMPFPQIVTIHKIKQLRYLDTPLGYFRPDIRNNYPIFDSFWITQNEVLLFQMMMSPRDNVSAEDLDKLAEVLQVCGHHALLPWKSGQNWHLIFVVPQSAADNWNQQTVPGAGKWDWPNFIDQYVLGIDYANILPVVSTSG